MHPQVDIVRTSTPIGSTATTGSHIVRPLARTLLEDQLPMRLSTAAALFSVLTSVLTSAGCLGEVGSERKPSTGSDEPPAMMTPATPAPLPAGACAKVEKPVTIRVPADMELLPRTGCYDIVGKLTIQSAQITSLAALRGLKSVSELELDYTALTTLDLEQPLNLYGPLRVTNNLVLRDLKQLQFATPPSSIVIDHNAALTTLDPFLAWAVPLTEVNGDLTITDNGALAQVMMPNVTRVAGVLTVAGNAAVAAVDLSRLATTHGIELADNPLLTSITGLAATEIAGDLAIRNNAKLAAIGTMGALVHVAGNVTIDSNAALVDLKAFTIAMKTIGQALTVTNNPSLVDLGMLKHLDSISAITIANNRNLVVCRAIEVDGCVVHAVTSHLENNRGGNCNSSCD